MSNGRTYPAPTFTDDGMRQLTRGQVQPAGPFGGNSQSGKVAKHGTQSGYVMHRRAARAEHDAAGPAHAAWCAGPSTHITECQPCKDAHAGYVRKGGTS